MPVLWIACILVCMFGLLVNVKPALEGDYDAFFIAIINSTALIFAIVSCALALGHVWSHS